MKNQKVKLNIGAGHTFIPGFINIDISPKADININISNTRLPFDDNSVDVVFSYHTLEHIPNYLFALGEIYRVTKNGALLFIGLPYVTQTEYNLVNPYHQHWFNEYSFDFFDPNKLKGSAEESNSITLKKCFHRFHYFKGFKYLPATLKNWSRRHLFNVVKKIDFGLIVVKKDTVTSLHNETDLINQFDGYLKSRIKY